jgi:dipeptidyl-peptidase-4
MIKNNTGYFHIYYVTNIADLQGPTVTPITNGTWDIIELLSYNPKTNSLFFTSTESQEDPTQSHVYLINLDNIKQRLSLTSDDTAFYTASFSPNGVNFVLNYMGPDIPFTELHSPPQKIDNSLKLNLITTLEDNNKLAMKLQAYAIPPKVYKTGSSADGKTMLHLYYMLPPAPSPAVYYPAIFDVYGGPESQSVTQAWSLGFDEFLASNNIIVFKVDPRGTGNRGLDFMHQVYGQLGHLEAEDVISIASQVGMNDYVDNGRIGIWGWSYGGFMALNTIIRGGATVFRMAISVAPVTDWQLYDTFYTERFMNIPKSNEPGYNTTSVIQNCGKLKDFPFWLSMAPVMIMSTSKIQHF